MAGTLPSTISTLSRLRYGVIVVLHVHTMGITTVACVTVCWCTYGVLFVVTAYSFLNLYYSESLVGAIPDTITTMTTLRFVGEPAAGACFASAVHALRCCDECCDACCNARLSCDLPCVADAFSLGSVASREVFRLASAT
jgi:hypothetical protein